MAHMDWAIDVPRNLLQIDAKSILILYFIDKDLKNQLISKKRYYPIKLIDGLYSVIRGHEEGISSNRLSLRNGEA